MRASPPSRLRFVAGAAAAFGALALACGGAPSATAPGPTGAHAAPDASTPDGHHHDFGDVDEWARTFDDPMRDAWQKPEEILELLAPADGATVVDLGAGTGYFTTRLAKRYPRARIVALDVEPKMVTYTRDRAAREGLTNVESLPTATTTLDVPRPADVVLVVDVYHHLDDRVAYFRRAAEKLAPKGRIAIVDFREDSPMGPPPDLRLSADVIVAEMGRAGYTLAQRSDALPYQFVLIFRR